MVKNEKLEKEGEMVRSKFVNISYRLVGLKAKGKITKEKFSDLTA